MQKPITRKMALTRQCHANTIPVVMPCFYTFDESRQLDTVGDRTDLDAALGVHKDGAIRSQIIYDNALVVVHWLPRSARTPEIVSRVVRQWVYTGAAWLQTVSLSYDADSSIQQRCHDSVGRDPAESWDRERSDHWPPSVDRGARLHPADQ